MKKIILYMSIISMCNIALANTIVVPSKQKSTVVITQPTSPTVQLPPTDPNAGDASAYTSPDDGLTSPTENAESGREYQEQEEVKNQLNPPPSPPPVPDQNSY